MQGYWSMLAQQPDISQAGANFVNAFMAAKAAKQRQQEIDQQNAARDYELERRKLMPEAVQSYQEGRPQMLQEIAPDAFLQLEQQRQGQEAARAKSIAGVKLYVARGLQSGALSQAQATAIMQKYGGQPDLGVLGNPVDLNPDPSRMEADATAVLGPQAEQAPVMDEIAKQVILGDNVQPNDPRFPPLYRKRLAEDRAAKQRQSIFGAPVLGGDFGPGALTGDEYLKTLPPSLAAIVKGTVEGRYPMPQGSALRSPAGQQIAMAVAQYEPGFDATQWQNRNAIRKDFATGKAAANVRSLNTMIHHVGRFIESAKALGNRGNTLWNAVANKTAEVTGDPRITKLRMDRTSIAGELAAIFKNTGGTDQEIAAIKEAIPENGSLDQQIEAAKEAINLGFGRLNALNDQYKNIHRGAGDFEFVSPEARKVLSDKLGITVGGESAPEQAGAASPGGPANDIRSMSDDELRRIAAGG